MARGRARVAGLLVMGGVVAALSGCGQDVSRETARPGTPSGNATSASSPSTSGSVGEVLKLSLPPAADAKCVLPNVQSLRGMETPFRGTVTSVVDGVAEFSVDEHFDDSTFTRATLPFRGPDAGISDGWTDLEQGATYLVASVDGVVVGCGFTGPDEPELAKLYDQAFAG